MPLNYHMIVEKYSKLNGVVGSSIFDYKIFSLLDEKVG